ncbi:MAG: DUF1501 domain-containing protein [Planctomycetaceae bacterium]
MTHSTRRDFLRSTAAASAVLTFTGTAPGFLQQAAAQGKSQERILVVVEMAGGNDGLNTIVPFGHDQYRKLRPELAIAREDVLSIDDELGFHPSLQGFAELLDAGRLAVVQGVGYPDPNQSHFESMDIWHTCQRKNENRIDGWLGRCLELNAGASQQDPAGLHLGSDKQPFALMSRNIRVPSIRTLDQFKLKSDDDQFRAAVRELADARRDAGNDLLGFVQTSTSSAIAASERIEAAGMQDKPSGEYPDSDLSRKLQTVARLIRSGLKTTVYYVQIDGFDTHANQPAAHSSLLKKVGESVAAFVTDMVACGEGDRVLVMCFSEFGRRVQENASEGTDHGTAGPMFLVGTKLKAGLIGAHPSLDDLRNGDLKHHTDFRSVYAAVLENWLGCESRTVLKGHFDPVDVLQANA